MSTIESNLTEATQLSTNLQTSADKGVIQSVNAAAQVNVSANVECISAYNDGMGVFSKYQTVAVRDASSIKSFATKMDGLDKEISEKISS